MINRSEDIPDLGGGLVVVCGLRVIILNILIVAFGRKVVPRCDACPV
jgi:hypothetical protein